MPTYPFLFACFYQNDWLYWCSFSSLLFWCLLTFDRPFIVHLYDPWTNINVAFCLGFKSLIEHILPPEMSIIWFFPQFSYCFFSDKLNLYLFFPWFVAFTISNLPVPVPPICISTHSNYPSLYEKVTCVVNANVSVSWAERLLYGSIQTFLY